VAQVTEGLPSKQRPYVEILGQSKRKKKKKMVWMSITNQRIKALSMMEVAHLTHASIALLMYHSKSPQLHWKIKVS
jgi:hypothetical protein